VHENILANDVLRLTFVKRPVNHQRIATSVSGQLLLLTLLGFQSAPAQITLASLAEANDHRDSAVAEVRSVRRYILHNARWSEDAMAEVMFTVKDGAHASYTIVQTSAKGFHREVLKRILDGEVEAYTKREAEITPANYETKDIGPRVVNGRTCHGLQLIPKKRTRYTMDGWVCVDVADRAILHIDGDTAKSLSFLVGKAHVTQDFRKIGAFWYSSLSKSAADVRLLGRTELTIEYLDYQITPKNGKALIACRTGGCSPALHAVAQAAELSLAIPGPAPRRPSNLD